MRLKRDGWQSNLGDIDLLVNNAAIAILEPVLETKVESWDATVAVNLRAALVVSQVVAKGMIERGVAGSIVNVSSMSSFQALPNHAAYAASKAGLDQLTKVMAVELGRYGIRVNSINPTVVMTEMGKRAWSDPDKGGPMLARIPLGRFAECEDIASVVCFVLSDAAGMLNGPSRRRRLLGNLGPNKVFGHLPQTTRGLEQVTIVHPRRRRHRLFILPFKT
jgi:L-xylulose reductase